MDYEMKYIDADKLKTKVKALNLVTKTYEEQVAFNNALAMVVEIINSLQQEQMTGLSIHDLELLHTFLYAVKNNKYGAFTFTRLSDEQYEEVLRRFNKAKEEEK